MPVTVRAFKLFYRHYRCCYRVLVTWRYVVADFAIQRVQTSVLLLELFSSLPEYFGRSHPLRTSRLTRIAESCFTSAKFSLSEMNLLACGGAGSAHRGANFPHHAELATEALL